MKNSEMKNSRTLQAGFSLIELMVSILILVIVMGAVFKQVNNVQKSSRSESLKMDLTQEDRSFVDQFARDLHMAGYPTSRLYQVGATGAKVQPTDNTVALGLVEATPTWIRFEGDVYGDGLVYSVLYRYFQVDPNNPPDPNCPCLRRSVTQKIQGGDPVTGQSNPVYYTEVQNVIDPTGMAQALFTYYRADGTPVPVGAGVNLNTAPGTIQLIDAVKVNLNTRSRYFDPQSRQQAVHSISTIAELEN
jgi:prepilin-type N-terminal cleavage/methylation domain-containing protein